MTDTDLAPGTAPGLELVDEASCAHLSGRFAPVHDELEVTDLAVDGDLPGELVGAYIRNGPNPKFTPLGSYTYPMEGDGMLHGLWFEDGRVRYKNRWVETNSLRSEERAGRALFGGIMNPAMVDPTLLGPDPDPGWPVKLDAFINIVHHGGRWLALEEGTPQYEVTAELETVGRYDWGGELPSGLTAHPRIDPATGEMVIFRYDVEQAPYLTWAIIGADGHVTSGPTAIDGVDQPVMIHDFVITPRWIVLTLAPVIFDLGAMMTGDPFVQWRPELGTRVAMVPRCGSGPTRWAHAPACWVWHFANAFEDGDRIVMDFPMWETCGFLVPGLPQGCRYVRAVLDPERQAMEVETVHERFNDFPRIDDRLTGQRHRHALVTASSGRTDLVVGEHDVLCRVDVDGDRWVEHTVDGVVGETVFAPRPGGTDDLDGWYLSFLNRFDGSTDLAVWDADTFPSEPRALVRLPRRVPSGLHGNWFPSA